MIKLDSVSEQTEQGLKPCPFCGSVVNFRIKTIPNKLKKEVIIPALILRFSSINFIESKDKMRDGI